MTEQRDDRERRHRLLGVKLRALVAEHLGVDVETEPEGFGAGAATLVGGAAWVLVDGPAQRRLGAALAWAVRRGASSLHVVADEGGGTLARRAGGFSFPVSVWFAHERTLLPVVAEEVEQRPAPDAHLAMAPMIDEAGATPRVEHGVVTGEVRGLEVCRVVDEPTTGNLVELGDLPFAPPRAPGDGGVVLEVGVGANDREAFQLVHGDVPTSEALAGVVEAVRRHRGGRAARHPLDRMAPERFLRWRAEVDPSLIGLASLEAAAPPVARRTMKQPEPCVGRGVDLDGRPSVAVFSAGVDLDLAPFVADVVVGLRREAEAEADPDAEAVRLLVVVPERDALPITRDLLALVDHPSELVTLDAEPAAEATA